MNSTTETADLLERIRHAAEEALSEDRDKILAGVTLLPDGSGSPLPPLPEFAAPPASDPMPLLEAASMLPRAREKNTVSKQVPGWLRPLWRNQGGFNGILLETCDRLTKVSHRLEQENARLREDLGVLHRHVGALTEQLATQNAQINALHGGLTQATEAFGESGQATRSRFDRLVSQGDHHAETLARMEIQNEHHLSWLSNLQVYVDAQSDREEESKGHAQQIREGLDRHAERIDELFRLEKQSAEHSQATDTRLDQAGHHVNGLQSHLDEHTAQFHEFSRQYAEHSATVDNRLDQVGNHVNGLQTQDGLQSHLDEHTAQFHEFSRQYAEHSATVDNRLDQVGNHVNGLQTQGEQLGQHVQSVHGHLDLLGEHVARVEGRMDHTTEAQQLVQAHADRLGTHLNHLQGHHDQQNDRFDTMQRHLDKLTELHERARGEMNAAVGQHRLLEESNRRLDERQINDASYLRAQLAFHQRLFGQWLAPMSPISDRAPDAGGDDARQRTAALFNAQQMDALYLAFEDAMRGSRHEIKERVRYYVPRLAAARSGGATGPVLDLGCGRGEWLEVLREENIPAVGVDTNVCMIDQCRERGLDVTLTNALDHLASLPDAACGAVTAFHLIEHLPFPDLVRLLTECRRVLQPGGIAIFETPNPANLVVGACNFYHDYTHQRPLPPTSTRFLVEHVGFAEVEVVPLHPWNEESFVHGDGTNQSLVERFNDLVYGPQDYAIVARAAADRNRS